MKKFLFSYKNGNALITINAETEEDAWSEIQEFAKDWHMFTLEESEE